MTPSFHEIEHQAADELIDRAFEEDLRDVGDLTCRALLPKDAVGKVHVVARKPGIVAGGPVAELVFSKLNSAVSFATLIHDGSRLETGSVVASISGPLRTLLIGERTALNLMTHLSGIATLTRQFVDAVDGTNATILDTRKTLPGYRILQKYAVRAGGGTNHRMGLYDGILIKDNHLAAWAAAGHCSIADAVVHARNTSPAGVSVEIEVDTLEQLADALNGGPDIVLLDNMNCETLCKAVAMRDSVASEVLLEASGGVSLETVADIARTGVDRISVGGLTHSAPSLDIAFDWVD